MNERTVTRDGWRFFQLAELFPLAQQLRLQFPVLLQHNSRRINDDRACVAIDNDPVVVIDQLRGIGHTNRRGYIETTRHDSGMRILTTEVSDKTHKGTVTKLQHVSRRDIVRNHNHLRHMLVCRDWRYARKRLR